ALAWRQRRPGPAAVERKSCAAIRAHGQAALVVALHGGLERQAAHLRPCAGRELAALALDPPARGRRIQHRSAAAVLGGRGIGERGYVAGREGAREPELYRRSRGDEIRDRPVPHQNDSDVASVSVEGLEDRKSTR